MRPGRALALSHLPEGAEGEVLVMLVECTVPQDGAAGTALAAAIRRSIRERTGVQPHAVELLAPGSLPRTSSGKLRRAEARRRYLAGELGPPGRGDALAVAGALVKSALGYARAHWRR